METATERLDPRPQLLRRMVWDIFPHDPELVRDAQVKLGLIPDGDDGMEAEHSASDTRMNRVAPLDQALELLAEYAAEVMGQFMVAVLESNAGCEVELPEDFHESFANQNSQVIHSSTYAILCHLMDKGVLVYGEKVRG